MIEIVVRELRDGWQVDRAETAILTTENEDDAMLFALGEASRLFEEGLMAQVAFRPMKATEET